MKIKLSIFNPNRKEKGCEPETFYYSGNWALETMIIKTSEKYFGEKISKQIESILKGV